MSNSNSQNFHPCDEVMLSSSFISSSSSKVVSGKKCVVQKDTSVVSACNKVDISETFNNSFVIPKGEQEQTCDFFCELVDNPSWGWIVLVFAVVLIFRKKLMLLLEKIEKSPAGSVKAGPVGASWNIMDEPEKVKVQTSKSTNPSVDNEINNENCDNSTYDEYYPHYDDILKNKVANKILSTLWFYQQEYGKENGNTKRWSFREPNDPDFDLFSLRLYWSGLIIANGSQYMLSNVGIRFCKKYESRLNMDEKELYSSFRV